MNTLNVLAVEQETDRAWPRLGNPPITEGLIDIRVSAAQSTRLPALEAMQDKLRDRYPNRKQRSSILATANIEAIGMPIDVQNTIDGYVFSDADAKRFFQARLDGFTLSRLPPYPGFTELTNEARELWGSYVDAIAARMVVERIALRYINRIEIPLPFADFKEYLLTFIDIAPGVPQTLIRSLTQNVVPDDESNSTAIITIVLDPLRVGATSATVIFDIDVYQEVRLDPRSDAVWDTVAQLRTFKNRIFFASMTPKALEMYQ